MITRFERLFSIGVTHAYYGGTCRDFAFTIPDDTAQTLRSRRMTARSVDDHLVVLYETDGGSATPLFESTGTRLRFALQLTNGLFRHFTALPVVPRASVRLYRNGASPTALDAPDAVPFASPLLTHTLTGPTRPATVTVMRGGVAIRSDAVNSDRATATFDLRGVDPGRIDVVEAFVGGATQTTPYYLDPELQRAGAFGIVEVDIAAGFYAAPGALNVAFDARREKLKYFVVVSNYTTPDFTALAVADAGFADDARPQIQFERVDPATFDDGEKQLGAAVTVAGSRLALFRSKAPVARRVRGNKKLQLKQNADTLIEHLPQPGSANVTSDLVVHLFKPKRA